jgi:Zn-dependent protease with chaperone function
LEHRLADGLYSELERGTIHRPGWDAARIGAYLLSGLVLLLPLASLLVGIALLLFYRPLWLSILLAVPPLALALLLRPRAHRPGPDAHLVRRDQAPTLFALLDQLTKTVGTRPITAVVVDATTDVAFVRVGWRFRPVISLGLALWTGLGPQERVAVLAHELGHGKNGDARHGWVVDTAESVLDELRTTFSAQPLDQDRQLLANLRWVDPTPAPLVTRIVNAVVGGAVRSYSWLLGRLDLRSSQRAEYLADRTAAEIAGSEATAWALERTLLADTSLRALEQAVRFDQGIDPLEAVRRAVTEIPAREIERRVRVSRLRDTRIDSTHPPTYLRTKLIRTRPAQHALVVLDTDRHNAIDRELAPTAEAVLKELRNELR